MNKQRAGLQRSNGPEELSPPTPDLERRVERGDAPRESDQPEHPLTIDETAEVLDCSGATVRRRIASGELLAFKHGRILRVLPSDLRAFVRASRKWR
jgi:excisionase family DNA binding protein